MDKKLKQQLTVIIAVSFLVSAAVGFVAGGLAGQLFGPGDLGASLLFRSEAPKLKAPKLIKTQEELVVQAVKEAAPAVVSVIVAKDLPVLEEYFEEDNPFEGDDFFRQFFGDDFFAPFKFQTPKYREKGTEKREIGGGTGFIVSSDGLILTNKHVVEDNKADYTVLTNEGEKISAQVLARDPIEDIAILKVNKNNLPVDYGALIIRGESPADLAVIPASPADKAGLAENDIILEVDNEKISRENPLAGIIQKRQPGDLVSLKVLRQRKEKMLQVILGEQT